MDRAEKTIGVFYFLAALAIAGLLVPIKWPKSAVPLAALTLMAAILCSGIAVYIAQPGGRVRHRNFGRMKFQLRLLKPITRTNNESILHTDSRFGPPSRLYDGSSTAADS
jgi:hypothetical protein